MADRGNDVDQLGMPLDYVKVLWHSPEGSHITKLMCYIHADRSFVHSYTFAFVVIMRRRHPAASDVRGCHSYIAISDRMVQWLCSVAM